MTVPIIITPQLTLRALENSDVKSLYRIYQTEGALQFFPNPQPPPIERLGQFINHQQDHWKKHAYGNWAITLPGKTEIIGWAGLQYLPETGETEVGYLLDRQFWGRGFATQAAWASLQFGFERFDFDKIIGLVHPDNLASQRVLEKCGLNFIDEKVYFGISLMRYWIERRSFQRLSAMRQGES
jgi:ribosomal-protein-alanine N-acetyltransferase